ncbi:MAG: DUF4118 domain-containing protein [Candidatus Omnitrophica bacterium]|nr:DUF4118 domain-containing protein [Candidatus Omnitrophota bacterium]
MASVAKQSPLWVAVGYGIAVGAVLAGLSLRLALTAGIGPGLPTHITFYPVVMMAALLAGFGPGLVATALSGLSVVYWVLPPFQHLSIAANVEHLGRGYTTRQICRVHSL